MSDTTNCPSCGNTVSSSAAFCTNCGHRMDPDPQAGQPPAAPETRSSASSTLPPPASFSPPAESDATRVDTPGLHDSTQVYTPPSPSSPWQPADQSAPTPSGPPTTAPWSPPESPPAPPWQQPAQPMAPGAEQPWGAPTVLPSQGPTASAQKSPLGGLAAIVGGIAILVGLFLPWLENTQTDDSTSGWNLTSGWSPAAGANELTSNDPYIVLALGIAALVVGFLLLQGTARPLARVASAVIGIAVVAVLIYDWLQVSDHVSDMDRSIEVKQAFGYFVTIGGAVLTAVGAILPAKK